MKSQSITRATTLLFLGFFLFIGCDRFEGPVAPETQQSSAAKSVAYTDLKSPAEFLISDNDARSASLREGLVSWWPANGNARDRIGANNGTLMNGATYAPGAIGQAFRFDGSDDYVDAGNDPSLNIRNAITLMAWIKLDGTGFDQKIISYFEPYEMGIFDNDKLEFLPSSGGFVSGVHREAPGGTVLQTNTWYHVAITWDGLTITSYVNGQVDRTAPYNNTLDTGTNNLNLGRASNEDFYLGGLIDEIAIWKRALTAAQVEWLYWMMQKRR
ncbi:MAG: LamG domain-containing protein [bacterium]